MPSRNGGNNGCSTTSFHKRVGTSCSQKQLRLSRNPNVSHPLLVDAAAAPHVSVFRYARVRHDIPFLDPGPWFLHSSSQPVGEANNAGTSLSIGFQFFFLLTGWMTLPHLFQYEDHHKRSAFYKPNNLRGLQPQRPLELKRVRMYGLRYCASGRLTIF